MIPDPLQPLAQLAATLAPYRNEFMALASLHRMAVLVPGADFAVVVRQSVRYGRAAGMVTALGIGAGISVHLVYTLVGVSALLHGSAWMMKAAQLLGACYLLYLAQGLLRSRPKRPVDPLHGIAAAAGVLPVQHRWQGFRQGFLTNATNPKATLFFLAVFTTVVGAQTPLPVQAAYGVWMCAVTAGWFVLVAAFFAQARVQRAFLAAGHRFEQTLGVLLLLLALRLFWGF